MNILFQMYTFFIFLIVILNIFKIQCQQVSCKTNCSINGTNDEQCWQQALIYRSSELIERLFQYSSLSVYLNSYKQFHPNSYEFNDTIDFLNQSLTDHLINESRTAQLNISLFQETRDLLLHFCDNLSNTSVRTSVKQLPSLSCAQFTCSSDRLNYMVLFITTAILCSLVFIMCIVQIIQTHRHSTSIFKHTLLQNSLSTTNTNC